MDGHDPLAVECMNCMYGEFEWVDDLRVKRAGICRRYAPRPSDDVSNKAIWPQVLNTDSCGEGKFRSAV
mgnify:CR=1